MNHVFGYASLVAHRGRGHVARLHGHRRVWGVAMDNRHDVPGYKSYRLAADGSRPAVFVAFLDIEPDPASAITGLCLAVSDDELRALDDRERNYDRVDVTAQVDAAPGRVWAYRGSEAGRARLRDARAQGCAAVSRAYLDGVRTAIAAVARHELAAIEHALAGLKVLELDHVEVG